MINEPHPAIVNEKGQTYFGIVLEKLRLAKDWPQDYVAYRLGIRRQHYHRLEQKGAVVSWLMVQKLSRLFEVSLEVFVDPSLNLNDPLPIEPYNWYRQKYMTPEKLEFICQMLARRFARKETLSHLASIFGFGVEWLKKFQKKPAIFDRVQQINRELYGKSKAEFVAQAVEEIHAKCEW